jgi:hypothetical protein
MRLEAAVLQARLPLTDVVCLRVGFRNEGPTPGSPALLPQPIELIQSALTRQPSLHQQAADHGPGTAYPRAAMHVDRPSGTHRIPNIVEYLGHLLA